MSLISSNPCTPPPPIATRRARRTWRAAARRMTRPHSRSCVGCSGNSSVAYLVIRSRNLECGEPRCPLGPLGSSSSQQRRTPGLVLQKSHASFRITFRPPGAGFNTKHQSTKAPRGRRTASCRTTRLLALFARRPPAAPILPVLPPAAPALPRPLRPLLLPLLQGSGLRVEG